MHDASAKRLEPIDAWRGIAISLVVLGHSIQATTALFDANVWFRCIYSFHMPLFFVISGLVSSRSLGRPLLRQLRGRTVALVVPFFAWFSLVWALGLLPDRSQSFLVELRRLFFGVDRGLWFLWVLFLVTVIAAIAVRIPSLTRLQSLLVASVVVRFIPWDAAGLGLAKWYFPFFAAGVLLAPMAESGHLTKSTHRWGDAVVILSWAALALGWRRSGLVWVAGRWGSFGLPGPGYVDLIVRYATASLGIWTTLVVVRYLPQAGRAWVWLRDLGRKTLELYVSHQLFLIPLAGAGVLWAPLAAIYAGAGALLLANLLKRVPLFRVALYGGRT